MERLTALICVICGVWRLFSDNHRDTETQRCVTEVFEIWPMMVPTSMVFLSNLKTDRRTQMNLSVLLFVSLCLRGNRGAKTLQVPIEGELWIDNQQPGPAKCGFSE